MPLSAAPWKIRMPPELIDRLKNTIQDCHLNFLIGAGLSCPFLSTLGNVEALLTALDSTPVVPETRQIVRASLYKHYFDSVIQKNLEILVGDPSASAVLNEYEQFLGCLNSLLLKRKVTILTKEVNLFTTNIDIFLDKALENLNLEYNDGFNGRFNPKFNLNNFKKSRFKKSLHYDKSAELPVFNLIKLHGSLSWVVQGEDVALAARLENIVTVAKSIPAPDRFVTVGATSKVDELIANASGLVAIADPAVTGFTSAYDEQLLIVNPDKEKFRHSIMNQTYYELLRLYSNELEKENSILFVLGFSFADEHIRDITIRVANSNPTLMIYVVAYSTATKENITGLFAGARLVNNNIDFLGPEQKDNGSGVLEDEFRYNFQAINQRILSAILASIDRNA
jgi:hypothetical protein